MLCSRYTLVAVLAAAFARTSMAQCDLCGNGGTFTAPGDTVIQLPQEILDQLPPGLPTLTCDFIESILPLIPPADCATIQGSPEELLIL